MSIDAEQLRLGVVRPALKWFGLYSKAAENLLMGTAAHESHLGTYLFQLGGGPALGIYQMEPATHDDIWEHYLRYKTGLADNLRQIAGVAEDEVPKAEILTWNLFYATVMARVHYLRRPEPLPLADNPYDIAEYWKEHYNTHKGRGTVGGFVASYVRFLSEG